MNGGRGRRVRERIRVGGGNIRGCCHVLSRILATFLQSFQKVYPFLALQFQLVQRVLKSLVGLRCGPVAGGDAVGVVVVDLVKSALPGT